MEVKFMRRLTESDIDALYEAMEERMMERMEALEKINTMKNNKNNSPQEFNDWNDFWKNLKEPSSKKTT